MLDMDSVECSLFQGFLYSFFLHMYFTLISSSTRVTVRISTQETIPSQVRILPFTSTFRCAGGCVGVVCWYELLSLPPVQSVVRADGQGQMSSDTTPWTGLVILNNWVSCADLLLCIWSSDALLCCIKTLCLILWPVYLGTSLCLKCGMSWFVPAHLPQCAQV